ncbi:MAG: hypothetical protein ACO1OQ_16980 [Rufibacter sp.]
MFFKKISQTAAMAALCALSMTSCKVADMREHEALAQTTSELPITGRKTISFKKDFKIGNFQVLDVHRGWTRDRGFGAGPFSASHKSQKMEFVLRDSAGIETFVTSEAALNTKEIKIGSIFSVGLGDEDNREIFITNIPSAESGNWQLITKDPGRDVVFKGFSGALRNGDKEIRVEPVHEYKSKFRGQSQDILGYEFKEGVELLAAVQVNGKGRVWLKNGLTADQRRVLSSAAASLLLYRKLNKPNSAEPQNAKVKLPLSVLR